MKKTLLFDIDGTLLKYNEKFSSPRGQAILQILKDLVSHSYHLVLITGNDYQIQHESVLKPLIEQDMGESVFCFSDGGSRAFQYNGSDFIELKEEYSSHNIITSQDADDIQTIFNNVLAEFLEKEHKLLIPTIESSARTLNYLDLLIFPIRPSFHQDEDKYDGFYNEIKKICDNRNEMKAATFELFKHRSSIIIRAHGQDPERDVLHLQSMLYRDILQRREFREISKPEFIRRGGNVICQIALKPFNDNTIRNEFRHRLTEILTGKGYVDFSILTGGSTTIDIQKKGVNKAKAIRFLIREKGYDPKGMIYFGDEFNAFGNDYPVLEMPDPERPAFIINVGKDSPLPSKLARYIKQDGNGPEGTMNYLDFLRYHTTL